MLRIFPICAGVLFPTFTPVGFRVPSPSSFPALAKSAETGRNRPSRIGRHRPKFARVAPALAEHRWQRDPRLGRRRSMLANSSQNCPESPELGGHRSRSNSSGNPPNSPEVFELVPDLLVDSAPRIGPSRPKIARSCLTWPKSPESCRHRPRFHRIRQRFAESPAEQADIARKRSILPRTRSSPPHCRRGRGCTAGQPALVCILALRARIQAQLRDSLPELAIPLLTAGA